MSLHFWLLALLGVAAVAFALYWFLADGPAKRGDHETESGASATFLAVGFVTNFFDTLGIGSFAPTTAIFKLRGMVRDERIPGTLNVGHALPTITQALVFVALVPVEPLTLSWLIVAAVVGAVAGARVVSVMPRRQVQRGMGVALLVAGGFFIARNLGVGAAGGEARALHGAWLAAGIAGNLALGALMTLGIGLYAPGMIMVALLGMHPAAAFPIMTASCAFLMPAASIRFISRGAYSRRAAFGLAVGGVPAVLLAAYVVKSLPLTTLRWLVSFVVLYTAILMLRSGFARRQAAEPVLPGKAGVPRALDV